MKQANTPPPETLLPVKQEPQALAGQMPAVNIEALIAKAIEQNSAFEVMKELETMRQRVNAERAEAAFNEAMAELQSEMPVITKDKGVPDKSGRIAYKFAPMEAIEIQIRPFLRKHGFTHSFDTDLTSEQGWVIAKCIVKHKLGHKTESVAKFPLGTKTAIMSDTQQFSAAMTFANRRVLCNAYGIVLAGEDIDGSSGRPKTAGPATVTQDAAMRAMIVDLWKLLKPVRGDKQDWDGANQWLYANGILDPAVEPPMRAEKLPMETLRAVIVKAKKILNPAATTEAKP